MKGEPTVETLLGPKDSLRGKPAKKQRFLMREEHISALCIDSNLQNCEGVIGLLKTH